MKTSSLDELRNKRKAPSWPEWLSRYPTSPAKIQTVYDACMQSRVFAPSAERPIVLREAEGRPVFASELLGISKQLTGVSERVERRSTSSISRTFKQTPGLKHQDWEARGIDFKHAVLIARQLQLTDYFSKKQKKLSHLLRTSSEILAQASMKDKKASPACKDEQSEFRETTAKWPSQPRSARQTSNANTHASQAHHILREGSDAETPESAQAERSRRLLKQRKQLEQASDAAEGIKSKRRPLRLAATSEGVPLTFKTMEKLRRFERRGREIVVDKEVRQRTKAASDDLAQRKRDRSRPKTGTAKQALLQDDHDSSKERGSS